MSRAEQDKELLPDLITDPQPGGLMLQLVAASYEQSVWSSATAMQAEQVFSVSQVLSRVLGVGQATVRQHSLGTWDISDISKDTYSTSISL